MSDEDRLRRIEAAALLALAMSTYAASEAYRRDRWKKRVRDALWPLL